MGNPPLTEFSSFPLPFLPTLLLLPLFNKTQKLCSFADRFKHRKAELRIFPHSSEDYVNGDLAWTSNRQVPQIWVGSGGPVRVTGTGDLVSL